MLGVECCGRSFFGCLPGSARRHYCGWHGAAFDGAGPPNCAIRNLSSSSPSSCPGLPVSSCHCYSLSLFSPVSPRSVQGVRSSHPAHVLTGGCDRRQLMSTKAPWTKNLFSTSLQFWLPALLSFCLHAPCPRELQPEVLAHPFTLFSPPHTVSAAEPEVLPHPLTPFFGGVRAFCPPFSHTVSEAKPEAKSTTSNRRGCGRATPCSRSVAVRHFSLCALCFCRFIET